LIHASFGVRRKSNERRVSHPALAAFSDAGRLSYYGHDLQFDSKQPTLYRMGRGIFLARVRLCEILDVGDQSHGSSAPRICGLARRIHTFALGWVLHRNLHLVIGSIAALVCYCVGSGVGISFDLSRLPSSISLDLPNLLLKEVSAWNQKAFTPSSPPS